jgi:hypothetical protein
MARTPAIEPAKTAEAQRLDEAREQGVPWRQWGPYLSERQFSACAPMRDADASERIDVDQGTDPATC